MRSKSHTEITSVSQPLVLEVVRDVGIPDNFVESAEATFAGLPDVDSDPRAREIMERLELARETIVAEANGNGGGASSSRASESSG